MKVFRPVCVGMAWLFLCFTLQAQELSVQGNASTDLIEQLFSVAPSNSATLKTYVSAASFLTLDRTKLRKLYLEQPNHFRLQVPQADGKLLEFELFREDILAASFYVDDQDNNIKDYEPGLYYHGFLVENPKSLVAISLFEDKVYGVLSMEGETYVLGHMNQDRFPAGQNYILYKKSDLLIQNNFHCATDHLPKLEEQQNDEEGDVGFSVGCKVVQIYFEADYRMFLDNGSSETETVDFITAMFNVVALLYKNENIVVKISKIRVWTTQDSYPSTSSTAALYAFRNRLGGQFEGNVAQLLSTVPANNGGVAYVGVLCAKAYGVSYSNIKNNFTQFPTYSWTVEVVTHELGHNFGSPHTQSCDWPGGPIDGCVPAEGSCARGPAPVGGGTIMSYCHLTNYGIDFQKGFGTLPGNLIRTKYQGAGCLSTIQEGCDGGGDNGGGGNGGGGNGGGGGGGNFGKPNLTRSTDNIIPTGLKVLASVIIINRGNGRSGSCKLSFYVSIDNSISATSDYLVQTVAVPGLGVGESYGASAQLDLSQLNVPPGNYYLGYIIDSADEIEETTKADNVWYWINPRFPLTNGGGGNGGGDGNGGGGNGGGGNGGGNNGTDYCKSTGKEVKYEWIARVAIGDIDNQTERDNGYGDYTRLSTSLQRGSTPTIRLTPGFRSQQYKEKWMVWIDFNQDKDFDDAGELVFSGEPTAEAITGRLTIPGNAREGKTRMRVSMKWFEEDEQAQRPCSDIGYGEVEDYTVEIVGGVTAFCDIGNVVPADQTQCDLRTKLYSQSLRIAYTGSPTKIEAKAGGKAFTFTATSSPQHIDLIDLPANGNTIDVEIKLSSDAGCAVTKNFQRLFKAPEPCEAVCSVPNPMGVETVSAAVVNVKWEAVQLAVYYQIRYREAGSTDWKFQTADRTSYEVKDITENSTYEYQLRANCNEIGWSDWSDTYIFVSSGSCGIPALRSVDVVSTKEMKVTWYPLPRASEYRIRYRATGTTNWMVRNTNNTTINLTELTAGTAYEYQLSAKCGVSWSGWSSIYLFITPSGLPDDLTTTSENSQSEVTIYPNPARDILQVRLSETSAATRVRINHINGGLASELLLTETDNQIDISMLYPGIYFLTTYHQDGTTQTQRFVKY